jgi:hypothetical protein
VPARFKQAVVLHVRGTYDADPDNMDKYLKAAENLIRPEKVNLNFA